MHKAIKGNRDHRDMSEQKEFKAPTVKLVKKATGEPRAQQDQLVKEDTTVLRALLENEVYKVYRVHQGLQDTRASKEFKDLQVNAAMLVFKDLLDRKESKAHKVTMDQRALTVYKEKKVLSEPKDYKEESERVELRDMQDVTEHRVLSAWTACKARRENLVLSAQKVQLAHKARLDRRVTTDTKARMAQEEHKDKRETLDWTVSREALECKAELARRAKKAHKDL